MSDTKRSITSRAMLWLGDDANVAEWVRQRVPDAREHGYGPCVAIGIVKDGKPVGGVVFNNYRGFDIHLSAACDDGCVLTRSAVRTLCEYPFIQLGVRRVTAITGKKNRRARHALHVLGFILEGTCKHALDGREDACVYGLLKENCRWIKNVQPHSAAAA